MTTDFLYSFIRRYKYAVVATVSPGNSPESACVGIAVTEDLKIIFDTVSDSRKYQNLLLNPNISFVIGCDNGQTIQYEGTATIPDANELDSILRVYFEIFPDGKERKENWKNIAYFCVVPRWIRFSDFNQTDTQIEEMKF
ncbi:MAG: pyridoxamine 5'-phosphate oxidase family protein [Ferruginibacter sp.]